MFVVSRYSSIKISFSVSSGDAVTTITPGDTVSSGDNMPVFHGDVVVKSVGEITPIAGVNQFCCAVGTRLVNGCVWCYSPFAFTNEVSAFKQRQLLI